MALKFLNKKGWHTGSLANIERVWKKEQVHKEEQRKLEEFKKQIAEEAEKAEFRQLQIDAGLVPRQERVDFLYEPGVSKGGSEGFKTLEALPTKAETDAAAAAAATAAAATASSKQQPGALFEEKPQSANDTWRKLHSDPLLMIKQREQEALARIKNNPVQMAKLKKSMEDKKEKKKKKKKEDKKRKHKNKKSDKDSDASEGEYTRKRSQSNNRDKHEKYSSEDRSDSEFEEKRKRGYDKHSSARGYDNRSDSEVDENRERRYDRYSSSKDRESERYTATRGKERSVDEERNTRGRHYGSRKDDHYRSGERSDSEDEERRDRRRYDRYSSKGHGSEKYVNGRDGERDRSGRDRNEERDLGRSHHRTDKKDERHYSNARPDSDSEESRKRSVEKKKHEMHSPLRTEASNTNLGRSYQKQRRVVTKLSEEEKAARLKEMQMDAVLHEEQRWNRLKKASDNDAKEASQASSAGGPNFLNAAQKSVYGAEKGGSSTIEESVRRRKYYSQGRSDANEGNAFRR